MKSNQLIIREDVSFDARDFKMCWIDKPDRLEQLKNLFRPFEGKLFVVCYEFQDGEIYTSENPMTYLNCSDEVERCSDEIVSALEQDEPSVSIDNIVSVKEVNSIPSVMNENTQENEDGVLLSDLDKINKLFSSEVRPEFQFLHPGILENSMMASIMKTRFLELVMFDFNPEEAILLERFKMIEKEPREIFVELVRLVTSLLDSYNLNIGLRYAETYLQEENETTDTQITAHSE